MHFRSGKTLEVMTKSTNSGACASSQSTQSSSQAQITQASAPLVGGYIFIFISTYLGSK